MESVGGGGIFRPDIPDPEMCHASSTLLWELSVFRVNELLYSMGLIINFFVNLHSVHPKVYYVNFV